MKQKRGFHNVTMFINNTGLRCALNHKYDLSSFLLHVLLFSLSFYTFFSFLVPFVRSFFSFSFYTFFSFRFPFTRSSLFSLLLHVLLFYFSFYTFFSFPFPSTRSSLFFWCFRWLCMMIIYFSISAKLFFLLMKIIAQLVTVKIYNFSTVYI